jgi:hypothetical protein
MTSAQKKAFAGAVIALLSLWIGSAVMTLQQPGPSWIGMATFLTMLAGMVTGIVILVVGVTALMEDNDRAKNTYR